MAAKRKTTKGTNDITVETKDVGTNDSQPDQQAGDLATFNGLPPRDTEDRINQPGPEEDPATSPYPEHQFKTIANPKRPLVAGDPSYITVPFDFEEGGSK